MAGGSTKKLKLRCWWCNKQLIAIAHAQIQTRDGHTVRVHKVCAAAAAKQEGTTGTVVATDSVPVHEDPHVVL